MGDLYRSFTVAALFPNRDRYGKLEEPVVAVQHVSKVYPLYRRPTDRLLELIPFRGTSLHRDFYALKDVNLKVGRGEIVALVGPNGSGKSTLLQIVSGILRPSSGRVVTTGRIAALLELGAGFNPEFTGRENVFLNGEIMGLSRQDVERVFPAIERFAEIGEFINRPVKEYSTGMYVRLAFATAIHVEPEILIVDEALAVGDAIFANRCIQKLEEMREKNVTILFVSHDLGLVKRLAHRAILMMNGHVLAEGKPKDVVNRYVGLVHEYEREKCASSGKLDASFRHGDGTSVIEDVKILDANGNATGVITSGDQITVRVRVRFNKESENPIVGILIRNRLGVDIFGTNTRLEQKSLGMFHAGETLEVDFGIDCLLTRQEYTLTVATQHWNGASQEWLDDVVAFTVADPKDVAGFAHLRTGIEWRKK
jgi:lipopolysaccharide transport system ATP-binding protein